MPVVCSAVNRQAGKRESNVHASPRTASKIPIVTECKRILPTQ